MKKESKLILLIVIVLVGSIALLAGSFRYVTKWRYTDIDMQVSPDERCHLTLSDMTAKSFRKRTFRSVMTGLFFDQKTGILSGTV